MAAMTLAALLQLTRTAPGRAAARVRRLARLGERDLWPLAAVVVLAALIGWRAQLVDRTYGDFTGCHGCLNASVAASDALLLAAFVAAVALARLDLPRIVRLACACMVLAGIALFGLDLVVFRLVTQRLLVSDLLHFSRDAGHLASVATPWLAQREGAITIAGIATACIAAWRSIAAAPRAARPGQWMVAAAAVFVAGTQVPHAEYLHEVAYLNVWQVNHRVDPSREYTERFHALHPAPPAPMLECEAGLGERTSVLLVVVESLSAYHSALFSGLNDDTPLLDALARTGTFSRAFHANGFSTEGGLIALLTGYVPIPTAGRFGSEMAFTEVRDDFHRWLVRNGYTTAFFTTGDLDMGRRGRWLHAIGIGHMEGADHPFYNAMPRGTFGAAADSALADRFLDWYDRERGKHPFMATLLTVGMHPPFVKPGVGVVGEREMVRDADRAVARLAAQLRARNFFDDGVMLVVGDHRAMTPIPHEERAALGSAAEVRVVGFAIGKTGLPPGELQGNFQQVDVIPSLRHLIAHRSCRDEWQGRFLGERPDPAVHVVHSDPLRRDELTVIDGEREFRIRLDGDDTRFVGPHPPPAQADALLQRVNHERMSRMPELGAPRRATTR
jgi:phosphoglycerol transferase MdoB-like AlkP superfamily enzyme